MRACEHRMSHVRLWNDAGVTWPSPLCSKASKNNAGGMCASHVAAYVDAECGREHYAVDCEHVIRLTVVHVQRPAYESAPTRTLHVNSVNADHRRTAPRQSQGATQRAESSGKTTCRVWQSVCMGPFEPVSTCSCVLNL